MKIFIGILLTGAILLTMTACGEGAQPLQTGENTEENDTGASLQQDVTDLANIPAVEKKLVVSFNGDNQATITLTDEAVATLAGLYKSSNVYCISIDFNADDYCIALNHDILSWNIARFSNDDMEMESNWSVNGEYNPAVFDGNTMAIKVNQVNIKSQLASCNDYRIIARYNDANNIIAEGKVSDIVGESSESNVQAMTITYPFENYARIKIPNSDIVEYLQSEQSYYDVSVLLYASKEDIETHTPLYELQPTIGEYSSTVIRKLEYVEEDGHTIISSTMLTQGDDDFSIGKAIIKDNALLIKYEYDNIEEIFSEMKYYEIEYNKDDNNMIAETGTLEGCYIDFSYNIPPVPEQLVTSDTDAKYFAPTTDNYKILEITFEDYAFSEVVWYQRMGYWVYGPTETRFTEDVKLVYLLSFDDFDEIIDAKMKIVYESENGQLSDMFMNYPNYIVAEAISGVNKADDSLITSELLESCDKAVYDNTEYNGKSLEYLGHYDNTRYYDIELFNEDFPTIVGWGFYANMKYTDVEYSNTVTNDIWTAINGTFYPIRTYTSK